MLSGLAGFLNFCHISPPAVTQGARLLFGPLRARGAVAVSNPSEGFVLSTGFNPSSVRRVLCACQRKERKSRCFGEWRCQKMGALSACAAAAATTTTSIAPRPRRCCQNNTGQTLRTPTRTTRTRAIFTTHLNFSYEVGCTIEAVDHA
jgi:hypothetical protein